MLQWYNLQESFPLPSFNLAINPLISAKTSHVKSLGAFRHLDTTRHFQSPFSFVNITPTPHHLLRSNANRLTQETLAQSDIPRHPSKPFYAIRAFCDIPTNFTNTKPSWKRLSHPTWTPRT